jgi:hypothetical protein
VRLVGERSEVLPWRRHSIATTHNWRCCLVETRVLGVLPVTRTDLGAWTSADMDLAQAEPFLSRDRLLGVIAMARRDEAARFDERDQAVLRRVAIHAVLVLDNATVHSEANQRRRGAQALARVARALSKTPELAAARAQGVGSVSALFGTPEQLGGCSPLETGARKHRRLIPHME